MQKTRINDMTQLRDRYHDYRRLMEVRAEEAGETDDLILTGTPVIFDKPYLLFKYNNKEVYEIIERGAFDEADYVDVPVKYNHGDSKGTPARTTSKTEKGRLTISVLPDRVDVRMNLLPTTGGKDLYEEVKAGTVSQMSWAFTEDYSQERTVEEADKVTIYVKKVLRVFDVSAVDFGANPETSIYARRRGDLDERAAALDERRRQALLHKINIKTKI
jgi:uncharacterized protein